MSRSVLRKLFVIELTVRGRGTFPVDMLRYESACPAAEHDAYAIAGEPDAPDRNVHLRRFSPSLEVHSNSIERWRSFGWKIVRAEHDGETIYVDLQSCAKAYTQETVP